MRQGDKGEIHLGDLITALGNLPWRDESHAQAIAACLGFGLEAEAIQHLPTQQKHIQNPAMKSPSAPRRSNSREQPAPPPLPVPIPMPDNRLAFHLQPLPERVAAAPDDTQTWLAEAYQLLEPEADGVSPARAELVATPVARGLLGAALATLRDGDEADLPKLLDQVLRGRLPHRVPRLPAPTLLRGCQLLLDYSQSMLPWWDDLRDLERQVRDIVGSERLQRFKFDRNPGAARARMREVAGWQPVTSRPVLVATDFAIPGNTLAERDAPSGWPDFVRACEAAGSPLLVLLPWPEDYWPQNLGPHPYLIHWHPHTSAAMVRRRVGAGHRVAP